MTIKSTIQATRKYNLWTRKWDRNGIYCNRTFKDLQSHFKNKHPELLKVSE